MLDDLTKTLKAQLYERANSPLFSSFALAWTAWNYKFILILISSMTAIDKIAYIDSQIFKTYKDALLSGFSYPLISAVLFIFIYPVPARYVYSYWQKKQAELKKVRQTIEDETPLPQADARELRRQAAQAGMEYDKELQNKSSEIQQLRDILSEKQSAANKSMPEDVIKMPSFQPMPEPELDENQLEILGKFADRSSFGIAFDIAVDEFGSDKIIAEYNIDELQKNQYINEFSEGGVRNLRITQSGRARVVKERKKTGEMSRNPKLAANG